MTDILLLIDCTLDDCAVSGDAMRWTAEPDVIRWMRVHVPELNLTNWQTELAARLYDVPCSRLTRLDPP